MDRTNRDRRPRRAPARARGRNGTAIRASSGVSGARPAEGARRAWAAHSRRRRPRHGGPQRGTDRRPAQCRDPGDPRRRAGSHRHERLPASQHHRDHDAGPLRRCGGPRDRPGAGRQPPDRRGRSLCAQRRLAEGPHAAGPQVLRHARRHSRPRPHRHRGRAPARRLQGADLLLRSRRSRRALSCGRQRAAARRAKRHPLRLRRRRAEGRRQADGRPRR